MIEDQDIEDMEDLEFLMNRNLTVDNYGGRLVGRSRFAKEPHYCDPPTKSGLFTMGEIFQCRCGNKFSVRKFDRRDGEDRLVWSPVFWGTLLTPSRSLRIVIALFLIGLPFWTTFENNWMDFFTEFPALPAWIYVLYFIALCSYSKVIGNSLLVKTTIRAQKIFFGA